MFEWWCGNRCLVLDIHTTKLDLTHRVSQQASKRQLAGVASRMVNDIDVVKAFVATASVYSNLRHGKWIPATYWSRKASVKLPSRITSSKLIKSLEKLHVTNRIFMENEETIEFGILNKVESTERRICRNGNSNPKRTVFLCVTTKSCSQERLPVNQTELANFFQAKYDLYNRRKSVLHFQPTPTKRAASHRFSLSPIPAQAVPTIQEPNSLHDNNNQDILALLQTIIRPEYLVKEDLLIKDACINSFRSELQKLGCSFQARQNKDHYESLAKDRYDDSIQVFNRQKYECFFRRFCCPWSKRAIQSFLLMALQFADDGDSSVLHLPKSGGVGYGPHLVPVIPGDTAKKLYKNGKGWMPRLYQELAGGAMTKGAYHLLHTSLEVAHS